MTTTIDHTSASATTPAAHGVPTPWPAILTVAAGAIFLDGAVLTAAFRNSSPVSEDAFAFPWQVTERR